MEIIKKGKLPKEKEYEATCTSCGTVVIFKRSESRLRLSYTRPHNFLDVICPLCKDIISAPDI